MAGYVPDAEGQRYVLTMSCHDMDSTISCIADAPKDSTFQMRINSEIKTQLECLFFDCGLSLTDAVNLFFQQCLNVGGLPFVVSGPSMTREDALEILISELQRSRDSVRSDDDYVSFEDIKQEFGSR